jgi:hypothetical protein
MGHRRRIQKKNFKCGHRGLGQYCHFCKQTKSEIIEEVKVKETPVQIVPNIEEPV